MPLINAETVPDGARAVLPEATKNTAPNASPTAALVKAYVNNRPMAGSPDGQAMLLEPQDMRTEGTDVRPEKKPGDSGDAPAQ